MIPFLRLACMDDFGVHDLHILVSILTSKLYISDLPFLETGTLQHFARNPKQLYWTLKYGCYNRQVLGLSMVERRQALRGRRIEMFKIWN